MPIRILAFYDLFKKYKLVFLAHWRVRHVNGAKNLESHELQFLPAHLELIETPIHPAPRWTIRIVSAMLLIALGIGAFFKLDIVVVAKGKLVPNQRVKVIQPALTGVVRKIMVKDGQIVTPGQVLIYLDDSQASADTDKALSTKLDSDFAAARASALLKAQADGIRPLVATVSGGTEDRQLEAQHLVDGAYQEYQDTLASARAELTKKVADLDETKQQVEKLSLTAPIARREAQDYEELSAGKYVPMHDYLDREKTATEAEHELSAQIIHERELFAAISEQRAVVSSITSKFRHEQLDALQKSTQEITQSNDDQTKAKIRQELLTINSPVAGTVQQLSIHTVGGVVTTAQSLMEIVPDDSLEVEASIENRDVGFVEVGQDVAVKIDAFPYTRYGYIKGTVASISNDSVQDKKIGLAFMAHVKLSATRIHIDNKWIDLTPGMGVSAEIKTGKRNVAGYFFGPLVQGAQESMRER